MTLAPPILDIFVVWHPDEVGGRELFAKLQDHFHSPAFSGLAGGAVEIYARSAPWGADGAPRPLGLLDELAPDVQRAQFNVILVLAGAELAIAVQAGGGWADYVHSISEFSPDDKIHVFSLLKPGFSIAGTALAPDIGSLQPLDSSGFSGAGVLGRELCQAITQRLNGGKRIQVFISHTKHPSLVEEVLNDGAWIYDQVRTAVGRTHLDDFFDAHDIQPGDDWEQALNMNAANSALLMVRTDSYAGREWTQREVFEAKAHDVPIVCMYALSDGEERGSFLMDHVPSVPCDILHDPEGGIELALNRLVDEALKRALWEAQRVYIKSDGFDWLPVHSPEPMTLAAWLKEYRKSNPTDAHVWIMHPDPPLGPRERQVVTDLCALAGYDQEVDILTPRTFAARGGVLRP